MRFFLPQSTKKDQSNTYQSIIADIEDQLGFSTTTRKIYSLEFMQDKKTYKAVVGELGQIQQHYEVIAIFEAKVFIIFTKNLRTHEARSILVNKEDVTEIVDFK